MADTTGLGYVGGALVFALALAVLAALYFRTNVSRVTLFWAAFILTRPLGATVGDFLDKPHSHGGLALSRPLASVVLMVFIVGLRAGAAAARRRASARTASGRFGARRLKPAKQEARHRRAFSAPRAAVRPTWFGHLSGCEG